MFRAVKLVIACLTASVVFAPRSWRRVLLLNETTYQNGRRGFLA